MKSCKDCGEPFPQLGRGWMRQRCAGCAVNNINKLRRQHYKNVTPRKTQFCVGCGVSILHHPPQSRRCKKCAHNQRNKLARIRNARNKI